jgi:thiamine biosynthesis lipoprotein
LPHLEDFTMADDITRREVHAMAMAFTIEIEGAEHAAAQRAIDALHADLQQADDLFSLWRDDTPMMAIAQGRLSVSDAPREVREVLDLCEHFRAVTRGAFDARRADGVVDPTGIVKAWSVARAAWRLGATGASRWMVGASGDVLTSSYGLAWNIGIADPRLAGNPQYGAVVDAVELGGAHCALATSGGAQDADHIWDPQTGLPAHHILQASVIGPDFVSCDAWATAIAAQGIDVAHMAVEAGYHVLVIDGERLDGTLAAHSSEGWPSAAAI